MSQSVPVQMAFALYTDKEGLDASLPSAAPAANRVWTSWVSTEGEDATVTPGSHSDNVVDDTISVAVRNGRFLVHLGEALANDIENSQIEILDSNFDHATLYVVTWVAQEVDGDGYNVFRLPPQKLGKVPHAVTAQRANGFEIKGDLQIDGKLYMGNGTTRPSISIDTPSSGDNWTKQGTFIEIGESVDSGSRAKMNMSYVGVGYGYTGAGILEDGIPSGGYWRFDYNSRDIHTYSDVYISGKLKALGMVPIGSIIAHHLNIANADDLANIRAAGFALCDGTTPVSQGIQSSVITAATPNLNEEVYDGARGRYLRGGNTSGIFNESSRYASNDNKYAFNNTSTTYYGAAYGKWYNTEFGNQLSYSTTDRHLGYPYVQVTAMTVVFIMRVK